MAISQDLLSSAAGAIGLDTFAAMTGLIREQQATAEVQQNRMLTLLKEQQDQMEAKHRVVAEQQQEEIERHRLQADEMKTQAVEGKLREQQLAALQMRLQALHAAKLLSDEELYRVEDILADSVEAEIAPDEGDAASAQAQVAIMAALSERLAVDATLARQLRRKFA